MTVTQENAAQAVKPIEEPDVLSLRRWKSGDMRGYNELIDRYKRPLLHYILRNVRDPDESRDVLQETFVRLYRSLPKLREDKSLKAWLYQTANHLSIDWLRKRKPDRVFAVDHQDNAFESMMDQSDSEQPKRPDEHYHDLCLQKKIIEAIDSLPSKQRIVMTLRSCKGLSIKEIGEILDCNEKTVGTTLFVARKKLLKMLKPLLSEDFSETFLE